LRHLRAVSDTTPASLDDLIGLAYRDLRSLAARYLQGEDPGHTLQPTALVHEAVLRLMAQQGARYHDRQHLVAIAASAMRRVLVDHARRRRANKRDAGVRVELLEELLSAQFADDEVLAVDDALARLAELDPRQAQIVELRYFAGFSIEATAAHIGLSPATVKRDWMLARAWLQRELTRHDA
jgi:RNA polymerase sigma factor (TIGR02999 family)